MIKNWRLILAITIFTSVVYSCGNKCGPGKPASAFSSRIAIVYIDKVSKQVLITEPPSIYLKSDIKVYDESLAPIDFKFDTQNSFLSFRTLRKKDTHPNVEYSYRMFIDLKSDRDTIDYFFKIKELDCGSVMDYIKVSYNGQQVANVINDLDATFNIEK